jgi:RNA polymerase sigma-70 factor (ECF subfamily)
MTSAADAALIEAMIAYQAGDLAAFEQLYALLVDDIRRYFQRHDRGGAAHDLTQELFLELHRARRTYTPPLPVRPWVFGIARHVAARSRRAAASHPAPGSAFERAADPAGPAPAMEALDVGPALAALPASTRNPWLLHHVLGESFESIATRLGVTVVAAKLRSSRAMRALRAALTREPPRGGGGDD